MCTTLRGFLLFFFFAFAAADAAPDDAPDAVVIFDKQMESSTSQTALSRMAGGL